MLFVCGCKSDWDEWATTSGLNFNESLTYRNKLTQTLSVQDYNSTEAYQGPWKGAFIEKGYQVVADCNSGSCNGYTALKGTTRNGERESSARAFILPNKLRQNLWVAKNAQVSSLVFDTNTPTKVVGVRIQTSGNALLLNPCPTIAVKANREVILSAGSYGTPKILLQSGIGKDTPTGVTKRGSATLPVGDNLQDHVVAVKFIKVNPTAPNQTLQDVLIDAYDYYYFPDLNTYPLRKGSFTNLGLMNLEGFIHTTNSSATCGNIQYIPYKFPKTQEFFRQILENFGLTNGYIDQVVEANYYYEIIMVFVILLKPKSTGTVKVSSSDWKLPPVINTRYFSDTTGPGGGSADRQTIIEGINKLQELIDTTAMQATGATMLKFNITECNSIAYPSDAYHACETKYLTANMWHPVGTCKMGASATGTVVDNNFSVRSFTSLRVVDGSVLPSGEFDRILNY
jgi:choline dehydrogenase